MAVPVNIVVKDESAIPVPIQSVLVNVYNPVTLSYITGAYTDGSGVASLLLPGSDPATEYELRCYKVGIQFPGPARIAVVEPLPVGEVAHVFDLTGVDGTAELPAADVNMCRVYGLFIGVNGSPKRNVVVRIAPAAEDGLETPKILAGNLVLSKPLELKTDDNGRVNFQLPRHGKYWVEFDGSSEEPWVVYVPDVSKVNLSDIVHPYPVSVTWDQTVAPGNAVSLAVGETLDVPFTAMFSDHIERTKGLRKWALMLVSNSSVLDVEVHEDSGKLVLRGKAAGTSQVTIDTVERAAPVRLPDSSVQIQFTALSVTVTS